MRDRLGEADTEFAKELLNIAYNVKFIKLTMKNLGFILKELDMAREEEPDYFRKQIWKERINKYKELFDQLKEELEGCSAFMKLGNFKEIVDDNE